MSPNARNVKNMRNVRYVRNVRNVRNVRYVRNARNVRDKAQLFSVTYKTVPDWQKNKKLSDTKLQHIFSGKV